MSPLRLDHLVYAVPELGAGVADLEKRLGIRATPGGKHVGLGTHNALIALGEDQYLELIAPDPEQPDPERPRPFGVDALTAGRLVTWAAKESDLEARAEAAREAGYDAGSIVDMSREAPGGQRISWRLTLSSTPVGDGLVPFLIDWGATPSPAGALPKGCRLVGLRAEHPEPGAVRAALDALGAELPLAQAAAASLIASLDTPLGRVELR